MFRSSALAILAATAVPVTSRAGERPEPTGEQPFQVVLEDVLRGDLVMVGNSNLLAAGGWRPSDEVGADVDGDRTRLCIGRAGAAPVCTDNSSSADLDLPPASRVVHARLYVETTLSTSARPVRVRLDGPDPGHDYLTLGAASRGVTKLSETSGTGRSGEVLRQAIWDVTDYVAADGAGSYTVADIVSERADAFLPYASWAIVAAYELDPAHAAETLDSEQRQRFASRAVSWHDGFVYLTDGSLDVTVNGLKTAPGRAAFARSFHLAAHSRAGSVDNLLFNGQPIGNNLTPGDGPPPPGVIVGDDPSCNSTTDVFNETICVLGSPVRTKVPGPAAYRASSDGVTRSSGSGVDIDVTRIPDRYLLTGSTAGVLSVRAVGDQGLALGMLAVSIDLAEEGQ